MLNGKKGMKNFIKVYKIKLSGQAVLKADTAERPVG